MDSINHEFDRLERIDAISKVRYSKWVVPTVYIKKKNMHFSTGLNEYLKIYEYPLSSVEDIFTKLNGGKIFSKLELELSDTYQQIRVDDETLKLLKINTNRGLYSFTCLLFGCNGAPSVSQNNNG